MTARRGSWLLVLAAVMTAACSNPMAPEAVDVSGRWTGTLTHPSYDGGSLTLLLADANGAVEGTYTLILSKRVGGRALVEQSGGRVSGSARDGSWSLLLQRSNGDVWLLEGSAGRSSASGEWMTERQVRGSYSVTR